MIPMRAFTKLASLGLFATCLCVPSITTAQSAATRADAEKDPVLKAMLAEMDRSMTELQLKDFAKPFFIQYRLEEIEDYQVKNKLPVTGQPDQGLNALLGIF